MQKFKSEIPKKQKDKVVDDELEFEKADDVDQFSMSFHSRNDSVTPGSNPNVRYSIRYDNDNEDQHLATDGNHLNTLA